MSSQNSAVMSTACSLRTCRNLLGMVRRNRPQAVCKPASPLTSLCGRCSSLLRSSSNFCLMLPMCSVTKASLPIGRASSGSSETVSPNMRIPLLSPILPWSVRRRGSFSMAFEDRPDLRLGFCNLRPPVAASVWISVIAYVTSLALPKSTVSST